MEYLVSFNITHNKTLLNPSNIPILYYSNSTNMDELFLELSNDENFIQFIDTNITPEQYGETKITYFMFTIVSEEYKEQISNLQDICKLDKLNSLKLKFIKEIFIYLFSYSHKNEKIDLSKYDNDIDLILHIYDVLKTKYSNKVSSTTIREYVNSQLKQKYHLSNKNTEEVLLTFDGIIL